MTNKKNKVAIKAIVIAVLIAVIALTIWLAPYFATGAPADGMIKRCRMVHLPFYPMYWLSFLVAGIWKILPGDPPIFPRRVDWYRQNRGFVIDKARRELEYEPKVKLDEGLKKAYDWYREHGYL